MCGSKYLLGFDELESHCFKGLATCFFSYPDHGLPPGRIKGPPFIKLDLICFFFLLLLLDLDLDFGFKNTGSGCISVGNMCR